MICSVQGMPYGTSTLQGLSSQHQCKGTDWLFVNSGSPLVVEQQE